MHYIASSNPRIQQNNSIRKSLIIDNAREIFGRYGIKKTTMEDIARSVNKAKGALY